LELIVWGELEGRLSPPLSAYTALGEPEADPPLLTRQWPDEGLIDHPITVVVKPITARLLELIGRDVKRWVLPPSLTETAL
jgi:hypothetical protein